MPDFSEFEISRDEWKAILKLLEGRPLSEQSNINRDLIQLERWDRSEDNMFLPSVLIFRWVTNPEGGPSEGAEAIIYGGKALPTD